MACQAAPEWRSAPASDPLRPAPPTEDGSQLGVAAAPSSIPPGIGVIVTGSGVVSTGRAWQTVGTMQAAIDPSTGILVLVT